jgi:hypothetical protein
VDGHPAALLDALAAAARRSGAVAGRQPARDGSVIDSSEARRKAMQRLIATVAEQDWRVRMSISSPKPSCRSCRPTVGDNTCRVLTARGFQIDPNGFLHGAAENRDILGLARVVG